MITQNICFFLLTNKKNIKKFGLKNKNALLAALHSVCDFCINYQSLFSGKINPCPAEPGYTMPLQTV